MIPLSHAPILLCSLEIWNFKHVWSSINLANSSGQVLHPALFILKIHFFSKGLKFLECHPPLTKQTYRKRCQEIGYFLLISSHSTSSLTMAGILAFLRWSRTPWTAPAHSHKACLKTPNPPVDSEPWQMVPGWVQGVYLGLKHEVMCVMDLHCSLLTL